jgi:Metal-sensitive transcriptional repressor
MSKTQPSSGQVHGYTKDKDALVKRLHRIEGQVRGIERMVQDRRRPSCSTPFTASRGRNSPKPTNYGPELIANHPPSRLPSGGICPTKEEAREQAARHR